VAITADERWIELYGILCDTEEGRLDYGQFRERLTLLREKFDAAWGYFGLLPFAHMAFRFYLVLLSAEIDPLEGDLPGQIGWFRRSLKREFIDGTWYFTNGTIVGETDNPVIPSGEVAPEIEAARTLLELTAPLTSGSDSLGPIEIRSVFESYRQIRPLNLISILAIQLCEALLEPHRVQCPDNIELIEERVEALVRSSSQTIFAPFALERIRQCGDRLDGRRAILMRVFDGVGVELSVTIEDIEPGRAN
jgi:hypothetical protein